NNSIFKSHKYPNAENIDWATTRNNILEKGNEVEIKLLKAVEDRFTLDPPSTSSRKVMAGAYCEELGGEVEFGYNLTKGENASFDFKSLDPVISEKIAFLNLVRQDALDG